MRNYSIWYDNLCDYFMEKGNTYVKKIPPFLIQVQYFTMGGQDAR